MSESRSRARAKALPLTTPAPVVVDPDVVGAYLEDASGIGAGTARGVVRPEDPSGAATFLRLTAGREVAVLPQAARSSLTGGAVPRGDVVLSCERWTGLRVEGGRAIAGAGVRLRDLQAHLRGHGFYFPPVPTYQEAMLGGAIATDAGGAATFRYGKTRAWVRGLRVILAGGDVLDLERGACVATSGSPFRVELADGSEIEIPFPPHRLPAIRKLSAGYWASDPLDLVDLFVGSEGTLGVIAEATLDLVPLPDAVVAALVFLRGTSAAFEASRRLCGLRDAGVRSVEFVDGNCLSLLRDHGDAERLRVTIPPGAGAALLVEAEGEASLEPLFEAIESAGALDPVAAATPGDEAARASLAELREAVPLRVNEILAERRRTDPGIAKCGGDLVVPVDALDAAYAFWTRAFEERGLAHAVWGHVSDGNLHPNALARSAAEVASAREALLEFGRDAKARGGAPLAEHGVGRSPLKQAMLREFVGDDAIAWMRAVKRALDPEGRLSPGTLLPRG